MNLSGPSKNRKLSRNVETLMSAFESGFVGDEDVLAVNEDALHARAAAAPDNPRVLSNLATYLSCKGDLEKAAALYRKALRLDPASFTVGYNLLVVLMKQGSFSEAIGIASGLDIPSEFESEVALQIGTCHLALRQYSSAISFLSEAVKGQPASNEAQFNLRQAMKRCTLSGAREMRWSSDSSEEGAS